MEILWERTGWSEMWMLAGAGADVIVSSAVIAVGMKWNLLNL